MSRVSETCWPYLQHRGGPAGFLKVISNNEIAFADYKGNRQMLRTGNVATNDRVCRFLVDYPRRERLKLLGHAEILDAHDHPGLVSPIAASDLVKIAYTVDTEWRNRADFLTGRAAVVEFLTRKWAKEHEYRLNKTLWAFTGNRIAVRFEYEWHDDHGQWWRSHGNENWEFDELGYMMRRFASINDQSIAEVERKFRWERL